MRPGLVTFAGLVLSVAGPAAEAGAQRLEAWVISRPTEAPSETGPFAVLLDHRSKLALTAAQVASIEEIRDRLVGENEPLVAQIRDAAVSGVKNEEEAVAIAAVRERFSMNTSAAERDAEEVLTPEQRETAQELREGASLAYAVPTGSDAWSIVEMVPTGDRENRVDASSTTVTVENLNFYDARVYAYVGSQRRRLGFVTGRTTQTFMVPAGLLFGGTGLRFQVQAIANPRAAMSNEVILHPGDEVLLRIPPF